MITIAELAHELGVSQSPDQPYSPADLFAGTAPHLVDDLGTLEDDTALTQAEADDIRAVFEEGIQ